MKTNKLIIIAGVAAIAYYLFKKKSSAGTEQPGTLKKFFSKVGESIGKPINEVDDSIPEPSKNPVGY